MILVRRRFVPMVLAVALLPVASAAAAGNPVRVCQEAIAKSGASLVAKVVRLEQACLRKLARGRLPAGTRCVGSGGDAGVISHPLVRAAVQRAIEFARATITEKCAGVDLFASPPHGLGIPLACPAIHPACVGTIAGADAAVQCQLCSHVSAAHYMLGVQYPGADATPDPNATPTPTPTATPGGPGSATVVAFDIIAVPRIAGFKFHVGYPGAKGRFRGNEDSVQCRTDTAFGFFISNHQQTQDNLITLIATAGILGLPTTIACTFDVAGNQALSPDDFTIIVDEVVDADGSQGDPNDLIVSATLATRTYPCLGGNATVAVGVDASYADLALTLRYPPATVRIGGTGRVDPWVGMGPFGTSMAEDVDTDADEVDDAVRITFSSNELKEPGAFAELHFDCLDDALAPTDFASFDCAVDLATDVGGNEVGAGCAVTRIGFASSLP